MSFDQTFIPYGAYWSTPFCRWQGGLATSHSVELAAQVARTALEARSISPEIFDGLVLGITVPQRHGFYGAPWLAGMIGAPALTGPTIAQACATSGRLLASAALEVETRLRQCVLAIAADRTSNGPHVYYPNPQGPGGMGDAENPVWDSFNKDPYAGVTMVETAENVAREAGIGRVEQDAMALLRYQQYQDALSADRAFQRKYMAPITLARGKKIVTKIDADEGVFPTTADGLAGLQPVVPGGSVTYGTQTHPADGSAAVLVCSEARARELRRDAAITIRLRSYAEARVKKGFMPMAVVPAARLALERSGRRIEDCKAIKTHNPFAVNDVYFCRELGLDPARVNRFGSPLIWGHPQAPTGLRCVIELIEELVAAGGGTGLFSGCAAGDSALALTIDVC